MKGVLQSHVCNQTSQGAEKGFARSTQILPELKAGQFFLLRSDGADERQGQKAEAQVPGRVARVTGESGRSDGAGFDPACSAGVFIVLCT